MYRRFHLSALFVAWLTVTPATASVLVVDASNGPGADHTDLQAAVDAAAERDVLLVRPGAYSSVVIDAKSLVVIADSIGKGALPNVFTGSITVRSLGAGQFVLVRGLRAQSAGASVSIGLNEGVVWLEDCVLVGEVLEIEEGSGAILRSCSVVGTEIVPVFQPQAAVEATLGSALSLFESTVAGFQGTFQDPTGGDAVFLADAALWLYDSMVAGGAGGDSGFFTGPGGDGIVAAGNSELRFLESAVEAGTGDPPGIPLVVAGGSVQTLAAIGRSSSTSPAPAFENAELTFTHTGLPGDLVVSVLSVQPTGPVTTPTWIGPWHLGLSPLLVFTAGEVPASGSLATTVELGELGNGVPGVEALTFFEQAFFVEPAPLRLVVGSPTAIVVLDESFR